MIFRTICLVALTTFSLSAGERSVLYPTDWKEGFSIADGAHIQDFSYAGYRGGGVPLPKGDFLPVINAGEAPFNADGSGKSNAQPAIQAAIDAAAAKGGGIVFIPAGFYRMDGDLLVKKSKIVLRGAGAKATRLLFTPAGTSNHPFIYFRHPGFKEKQSFPLTKDTATFDRVIQVKNTEGLKVGDDVVVGFRLTDRYKAEHGMQKYWYMRKPGSWVQRFWRTVTALTPTTIEVDVPLRYPVKVADQAEVHKVENMLSECALEDLGVSNAADMADAWTRTNTTLIRFWGTRDCWIRGVESFAFPGREPYHLQSKGIQVCESKRVTVADCKIENPQNLGGGGNGYLFELTRTDEVLVRDCVAVNGRHNFSINSIMGASGCVFQRVKSSGCRSFADYEHFKATEKGEKRAWSAFSDIHSGLTVALLVENSQLDDGWDVRNRHGWSNGAGITATEMVFWNNTGKGKIISFQYGLGYILGGAKSLKIITKEADNPKGFSGTAPEDYTEKLGIMLEPQSLYDDQLKRRLQNTPVTP